MGAVHGRRGDEHGRAQAQRDDEQGGREIAQPVVVDARGGGHQDDAEERVHGLPLEIGHRVAVAERGGRRGRAVDHHEPERDEPERDEGQEPLVEAAVGRPAHAKLLDEAPKRRPPVLEALELVEARTGR